MINLPQMIIVIISALNPVTALVLYSNLRKNLNSGENYLAAAVSALTIFASLSIFLLYGGAILRFFGIPIYIMELGGGLLLSILGLFNVLANEYLVEVRFYLQKLIGMFGMSGSPDIKKLDLNVVIESHKYKSWVSIGICPIALPIMINPSSVLVCFFLNGQINQSISSTLCVMLLISLFVFLLLISSSLLVKHVAPIWWIIVNRTTGLFLTTIGLEMLVSSFRVIFGSLFNFV